MKRMFQRQQIGAAALWCYWLLLFVLTHLPKVPKFPGPHLSDKVVHFVAYAILTGLALASGAWGNLSLRQRVWQWVPLLLAYGAIDELLQPIVGRHADAMDFMADAAGVMVVSLVAILLPSRKARH